MPSSSEEWDLRTSVPPISNPESQLPPPLLFQDTSLSSSIEISPWFTDRLAHDNAYGPSASERHIQIGSHHGMSEWVHDYTRLQLDTIFDRSMYTNQYNNSSSAFEDNPLVMHDFGMPLDQSAYPTLPCLDEHAPLAHAFDEYFHYPGDSETHTAAFLLPGQFIPSLMTIQPTALQYQGQLEDLTSPSTVTMHSPASTITQPFDAESDFEWMGMIDVAAQPSTLPGMSSCEVRGSDEDSLGNDSST